MPVIVHGFDKKWSKRDSGEEIEREQESRFEVKRLVGRPPLDGQELWERTV